MDSQKAPVASVLERLTKGVRSMSPQHNRFHERLQSRSLFLDLAYKAVGATRRWRNANVTLSDP